ncbi:hypothetical protein AcV5_002326 [Taiwanofungus camphoratus]|nr:hypothetical protein AcV5_002326 [Antrodia cinnamomea]
MHTRALASRKSTPPPREHKVQREPAAASESPVKQTTARELSRVIDDSAEQASAQRSEVGQLVEYGSRTASTVRGKTWYTIVTERTGEDGCQKNKKLGTTTPPPASVACELRVGILEEEEYIEPDQR